MTCEVVRLILRRRSPTPESGNSITIELIAYYVLFFRPPQGSRSPPAGGVLLPTTLDDFDDSVLGDPITYARCEQFPGLFPRVEVDDLVPAP